jgi:hypothetical protein
MVEFALVFPVVIMLCLGLITGSWLFWQKASLADGAKGGVRAAAIMSMQNVSGQPGSTPLVFKPASGPDLCAGSLGGAGAGNGIGGESGVPEKIEAEVAHGADQVPINDIPLCAGWAVADTQWGGTITPAMAAAYNGVTPTDCSGSHKPIQLTQKNADPSKGVIFVDPPTKINPLTGATVVDGGDLCSGALTSVIITVRRDTTGLSFPLKQVYTMHASSKMPCYPKKCG